MAPFHNILKLSLVAHLASTVSATLNIAAVLAWIEHVPLLVTTQDFYPASSQPPVLINGGVAELVSNDTIDLAANAETQAVRGFAKNDSLRIIWNVASVAYRLVVNTHALTADGTRNITTLADLRGKKIGTIVGASAGYFVEALLKTAGLNHDDYEIVVSGICHEAPCGNRTFPALFARGEIDAFGVWEPTVELGIQALPADQTKVFQDKKVYREIYNLHSTKEKLEKPEKRKEIVGFLKNLIQAQSVFEYSPEKVYERTSNAVNISVPLLEKVWRIHDWSGGLPADLLDVLEVEDEYIARLDGREPNTREKLKEMIDTSVMEEALEQLRAERANEWF
ncbi:hypothetical protein QBC38DRAFT_529719 [Podospora fimiseda]|uniref:SsuA/THI5-like domain-containing protein n=1 Tax=Podospora fimiseda TaxID=252190 RepID=A0AAN7BMI5_9PEZI|nr:hypothetical protein QBC38DRAFT_529719 [Podospora fimiseda]